jgi:peptidoglycan DL-endopeptidase CwlO
MSDTTATLTSPTGSPVPHIRRRRRASQNAGPNNWARRAGVAGGFIGTTLALSGMATASSADTPANDQTTTGSIPVLPALNTDQSSSEAVQALGQTAVDLQLDAARDEAATAARKQAQRAQAAQAARKAAAEKAAAEKAAAAREVATATASRSSVRASLDISSASGSIATVLDFLKAQVGKPYVYGATGPTAYDCSGLTKAAFATIGVDLPRTSEDQSTVGTPVSVSNVQPGDLLFWGGTGTAYHVAVYIGGGEYLDAANPSKGVVIQQMSYFMPTSAVRVV